MIAIVAGLLVTSMGMSIKVPSDGTPSTLSLDDGQESFPSSGPVRTNITNIDTDGDGLLDSYEPQVGTDPTNADTDGDGLWDGHECIIGTDPSGRDTDYDGLWDGQEVKKNERDECYTGTDPLRWDTDGDGVGDAEEDEDGDHLPNGEEWRYVGSTGRPVRWTCVRDADTDGDGVLDGHEKYGNPDNKDQTSDPTRIDTDGDRLTDDLDPRTWIKDYLPFSRIRGNSVLRGPVYPMLVTRGEPFTVEGWVEINTTFYSGGDTGNWRRSIEPMEVQVSVLQDDGMVHISDSVVTGDRGAFKIVCIIGDDVGTGESILVITTNHYQKVVYFPVLWDELQGNHLPF
jgi:hypothetical protein